MKKSFLKFLLSICILLSSVYNPLFANINSGETSLQSIEQFSISTITQIRQQKATISSAFDHTNKALELNAVEFEEEKENEPSFFKKGGELSFTSTSFYLLSLLFLFSYFKNRNRFQSLSTTFFNVNKRFVLFQVFRL